MSIGFNSEDLENEGCSEPNLENQIYKLTQRVGILEKKNYKVNWTILWGLTILFKHYKYEKPEVILNKKNLPAQTAAFAGPGNLFQYKEQTTNAK